MATLASAEQQEVMPNNPHNKLWEKVLAKLKFMHGEATFNSWFKNLKLESCEFGELNIKVPTRFMRDWVELHYLEDIRKCYAEEDDSITSVNIKVASNPPEPYAKNGGHGLTEEHQNAIISSNNYSSTKSAHSTEENSLDQLSTPLDPRFTFDNFVVGQTNELAHAAARSVGESGTVVPGSNPLFLYGGVGLGKTHLMQAIAWHIRQNSPEHQVVYLSAEKFMYQFIRALRNKEIVSFKEHFRSVDVLMIDDIQFICGKNSTQEEFFHTFNALIDSGKQLILSGDRSPSDLDGMEERIRSRLGWGLVADINATTYELRLGILQSKVERMGVDVPKEVLEFLAQKITSNIRELEGALNKVVAHSKLIKREITIENTNIILRDLLRFNERSLTVEDIKQKVSEHCNIRVSDMSSSRRARSVSRPRQLAMYFSKKFTAHSLPEIGRKFGGKDHTTVMHAIKRVEELYQEDKEFRDDVDLLTRMLQN